MMLLLLLLYAEFRGQKRRNDEGQNYNLSRDKTRTSTITAFRRDDGTNDLCTAVVTYDVNDM